MFSIPFFSFLTIDPYPYAKTRLAKLTPWECSFQTWPKTAEMQTFKSIGSQFRALHGPFLSLQSDSSPFFLPEEETSWWNISFFLSFKLSIWMRPNAPMRRTVTLSTQPSAIYMAVRKLSLNMSEDHSNESCWNPYAKVFCRDSLLASQVFARCLTNFGSKCQGLQVVLCQNEVHEVAFDPFLKFVCGLCGGAWKARGSHRRFGHLCGCLEQFAAEGKVLNTFRMLDTHHFPSSHFWEVKCFWRWRVS